MSSGQREAESQRVSEVELILNRAGNFVLTEEEKTAMTKRPKHRKLTTHWPGRKSSTCSYPTQIETPSCQQKYIEFIMQQFP